MLLDTMEENAQLPDTQPKADKPLNIIDEARAIRDDIKKEKDELKDEREKMERLRSENILAGNTGERVEPKALSPNEQRIANAREFFKGMALEEDIIKANELIK